jgi:hypothetical protein
MPPSKLEVELLEEVFMKIQAGTKQDLRYLVTNLLISQNHNTEFLYLMIVNMVLLLETKPLVFLFLKQVNFLGHKQIK